MPDVIKMIALSFVRRPVLVAFYLSFFAGLLFGLNSFFSKPDFPFNPEYSEVIKYVTANGKNELYESYTSFKPGMRLAVLDVMHLIFSGDSNVEFESITFSIDRSDAFQFMLRGMGDVVRENRVEAANYIIADSLCSADEDYRELSHFLNSREGTSKPIWQYIAGQGHSGLIADKYIIRALSGDYTAEAMLAFHSKYEQTELNPSLNTLCQMFMSHDITAVRWALRKIIFGKFHNLGDKESEQTDLVVTSAEFREFIELFTHSEVYEQLRDFEKRSFDVIVKMDPSAITRKSELLCFKASEELALLKQSEVSNQK